MVGYIGKLDGIRIHRVQYPVNTVDAETGSLLYSVHSMELDGACYSNTTRETVECHSYVCNVSPDNEVEVLRYIISNLKESNEFTNLYLMSIQPYISKDSDRRSLVRVGIK